MPKKGFKHSKESIEKMRKAALSMPQERKDKIAATLKRVLKGRTPSKATIEAARKRNSQQKTEEHKRKISQSLTGKKQSAETIAKRVAKNTGKKRTDITRLRLSEGQRGKRRPQTSGSRNGNWNGGSSFEPYCPKFNGAFKYRVRSYFDFTCAECGKTQEENGIALAVHHVNYNKQTCCNNEQPMFVALCSSCHSKTHWDRKYWKTHFTNLLTYLYNGKGYL